MLYVLPYVLQWPDDYGVWCMFGLTFDGAYKLHVHGRVCDDLMLQIVAYTGWVCDELMLKTMIVKCN